MEIGTARKLMIWKKSECPSCEFKSVCPQKATNLYHCSKEDEIELNHLGPEIAWIINTIRCYVSDRLPPLITKPSGVYSARPTSPPPDKSATLLCNYREFLE